MMNSREGMREFSATCVCMKTTAFYDTIMFAADDREISQIQGSTQLKSLKSRCCKKVFILLHLQHQVTE